VNRHLQVKRSWAFANATRCVVMRAVARTVIATELT